MVAGAPLSVALDTDQLARLAPLTNILVRLEIRCWHDSRAVRLPLGTPLDAFSAAAPIDRIGH